jgi:hypothetical protein
VTNPVGGYWDRICVGATLTTLLDVGAELAAQENRNRVVIGAHDTLHDSDKPLS